MADRPPLNSRIRFDDGREAEVVEHTERGFKYKGEPYSICPRIGLNMTGEGEVFTDIPEYAISLSGPHPYFTVI